MLSSETKMCGPPPTRARKPLGIEWIRQTSASIFWIASVFAHGASSTGDVLQLAAASAWFMANVFVAISHLNDRDPEPRTK